MELKEEKNRLDAYIPTKIKSQELIDDKRRQIIKGALSVFKKKGYHKTTVRDIAKAAEIGMGSLYDYICSKEDILYLFYKVFILTYYQKVISVTSSIGDPVEKLKVAYRTLLEVGFSLEDEVLFGWTEAKNVNKTYLKEILKQEMDLINYFKEILDAIHMQHGTEVGDTYLAANFLVFAAVFGILRNWALKHRYSKDQIIDYLMHSQLNRLIPPQMA